MRAEKITSDSYYSHHYCADCLEKGWNTSADVVVREMIGQADFPLCNECYSFMGGPEPEDEE